MAKRGRKKGIKTRVDKTIDKIVGTPEQKKAKDMFVMPGHSTDGDPLDTGRTEMYEDYANSKPNETGTLPVPDLELKAEDETVVPAETETASQEDVKQKVEKEVLEEKIALRDDREDVVKAEEELAKVTEERKQIITEPPAEEVVKQKDGISENEFLKTVPYDALFAEREKRKELKRQNDALLLKLAEAEKIKDLSKDETPTAVDDEIVTRGELERVSRELQGIQGKLVQDEAQQKQALLNAQLKTVSGELTAAGYPGFEQFGRHVVRERLFELQTENPELAQDHDTPEGWKKIWVDEYPKLKSVFTAQAREENFNKKVALKVDANLVSSHGRTDKPEVGVKKEMTKEEQYAEYLKMRREKAL